MATKGTVKKKSKKVASKTRKGKEVKEQVAYEERDESLEGDEFAEDVPSDFTEEDGVEECEDLEAVGEYESNVFADSSNLTEVSDLDLAAETEKASKKRKEVEVILPEDFKDIDLRTKAKNLRNEIDGQTFVLGEMLYYIKINELYKEWDVDENHPGPKYETFTEYLASEEAGSERRVRYLIELHEWFIQDIRDRKTIEQIKLVGWSKAREIMSYAKLVNENNDGILEWVETAKDMSLVKLTKYIKDKKSEVNDAKEPDVTKPVDIDKPKKFSCNLYSEQYKIVTDALEVVKKDANSEDPGYLLSLALQDFLANSYSSKPEDLTAKVIPAFEERFRVRLIAISVASNEVIYGQHLLEGDQEEAEAE